MSWAKVKKINSDMSMPLDELIKGQKRIGASDATYAVISSIPQSGSSYFGSFIPNVDGSIRIIAIGSSTSTTSSGVVTARINGVNNEIFFDEYNSSKKHLDIAVKKGVAVEFSQRGNIHTTSIIIGASLIDETLGKFMPN